MKTRCYLCNGIITIIPDRPKVCTTCKTLMAYIVRNSHQADSKIAELKIRTLALTQISNNPKLSAAEALRRALALRRAIKIQQKTNLEN